MKYKYFYLTQ